jgi:hypothetical protein
MQFPEVDSKFSVDSECMLHSATITKDDRRYRLKIPKLNKALGVDDIVPKLLIENAECLSEPLLYMFLDSMERGIVPKDSKCANMMAKFKKGSEDN